MEAADKITKRIPVAFRIGRGGKDFTPGHKYYTPYVNSLADFFRDTDRLADCETDGQGLEGETLPPDMWKIIDENGRTLLTGRDSIRSETGVLDRAGDEDTEIVKYFDECTPEEIAELVRSYRLGQFMGEDLEAAVLRSM